MDMLITTDGPADDLRDLYMWLTGEPELRGQASLRERPPPPGALGPVLDGLHVALGSGGAVATLAGVVIAWLKTRPAEITVRLRRGDDEFELTATGVKSLDAPALADLTKRVAQVAEKSLTSGEDTTG
ncbi:hypothetical protein ABGB17_16840 [Sphaerisporangium sp. B11E5]|uniref:effector-associated constant component EACC1 n=1 Tax=Sphaerisporangium sp. B11E5 TaxID=3153563 RepID=UPI00325DC1B1